MKAGHKKEIIATLLRARRYDLANAVSSLEVTAQAKTYADMEQSLQLKLLKATIPGLQKLLLKFPGLQGRPKLDVSPPASLNITFRGDDGGDNAIVVQATPYDRHTIEVYVWWTSGAGRKEEYETIEKSALDDATLAEMVVKIMREIRKK